MTMTPDAARTLTVASRGPIRVSSRVPSGVLTRGLALVLAGLLGACSGSEDPPGAAPAGAPQGRLRLQLDGPAPIAEAPRTVWQTSAAEDTDRWWSDAARSTALEKDGDRGPRVRFEDPDAFAVLLPGPFDPRTFNRLLLTLDLDRVEYLELSLRREGAKSFVLKGRELYPDERTQVIDLAGLPRDAGPFDDLLLVFAGASGYVELERCELVNCPVTTYLPPSAAPTSIRIGTDHRPGLGVFPGAPAVARFVPRDGERLELALGVPALAAGGGGRVSVTIGGSGGVERQDRTIEELRGTWDQLVLPLRSFVGESVEVRVEILDPPAGELVGVAVSSPRRVQRRPEAPTVLLVTSDTHRADHVGAAGAGVDVRTETLDEIAATGVLFLDAMSVSNVTVPSHASILTGLPPAQTGVLGNLDSLASEAVTIAERFSEAGYTCMASVSTVLLAPDTSGLGQGFDRFDRPLEGQRDSVRTIRNLAAWLPEVTDQPLFVWLHLYDAHTPYDPRPRFRSHYPADRDPRSADLPELPAHQRAFWDPSIRDRAYVESLYRSEVDYVDFRLGKLLDAHPRLARGTIAVTADHGESLGEQDVWWSHDLLDASTLRVPLLLRWPEAASDRRGRRVRAPVSNAQLGEALLDLAGLPAVVGGDSLLAAAEERVGAGAPRFAIADDGKACSIEAEGWLLILHLADQQVPPGGPVLRERHQVNLYNLGADPLCEVDLVDRERSQATRLRQALIRHLRSATLEFAGERNVSAAFQAELGGLGYSSRGRAAGTLFDEDCECARCRALR